MIVQHLETAPVHCAAKGNAEETLRTIRSNYIVVKVTNPVPVLTVATQPQASSKPFRHRCKYEFVEKTNSNQMPSSIVTAECKSSPLVCRFLCRPRKYYITVLEKDAACDDQIGQTVWRQKKVEVVIGYDALV